MRRIGTVLAAMLVIAASMAVIVRHHPPSRVPLPPRGEVAPAFLYDGLPVFVVHREDGEVRVFDARSPHRPHAWSHLVGWCTSAGVFEDPFYGSRFTWTGHWMGGPAPTGLTAFAAHVVDRHVVVGAPRTPPQRHDPGYPADGDATGPSCLGSDPADSAGMLTHDAALPETVPWVDEAAAVAGGHWRPAAGVVVEHTGERVRLCRRASGDPPRCADGVSWTVPPGPPGEAWSRADGRFLILSTRGAVRDVIVLVQSSMDTAYVAGRDRMFGLAVRVVDGDGGPELEFLFAEWLSGEQAAEAARADGALAPGETLPNDYYIDVAESDERGLAMLADDVVVRGSISLEGSVELVPSSLATLRRVVEASAYPIPVWMEVDRATGEVVLIEEQYRP